MLRTLYTRRGEQMLGPVSEKPWEAHPRPQMRRNSYVNLNGNWLFRVSQDPTVPEKVADDQLPKQYPYGIKVPFCPESVLSDLKMHINPGSWLFYFYRVKVPADFRKDRILLHIGAADQVADIYVNHSHLCHHEGGYESFCVDITDAIMADTFDLVIRCHDDLRDQSFPYGKQTLNRGGMWYTPVSGIWQSVWMESVPAEYIRALHIENRGASVTITTEPALAGKVILAGQEYPLANGSVTITPDTPHFWSPEDPYLYEFTVETACDRVESYFALRTLETKTVNGIPRLCLNGKPYFFHGLLDQGYWPDGLLTPAAPECYADDILAMKNLGFNMLRKHIKVEPEEFYYQCDKLGMLVFQDMVNNGDYSFFRDTAVPTVGIQKMDDRRLHRDKTARQRFLAGMESTVRQLKNHPCIVYWTIFNEGWGQFDSDNVYRQLKRLDDTRFIDSTSGWFRRNCSDVESLHIYFGSWNKVKACDKPLVLSEFGGYAYGVEDHIFNPDKAYGYRSCKTEADFRKDLTALYEEKVIPAVAKGLCAAVYTQVSDVEDEINGLLTYDRKVCKADPDTMRAIAKKLYEAIL